jgi:Tfp pilus assembly protein PilN
LGDLALSAIWSRAGRLFSRLVPKTLFQSGGFALSPAVMRIDRLPLDTAMRAQLRKFIGRDRGVVLSLDPRLALAKRLRIPRAAAALSEGAISLNIRQSMPNQGKGLVWRSALIEQHDGQADYVVYMFKEQLLQELAGEVQKLGVTVHSIVLAGLDVPPVWELQPDAPGRRRFWLAATFVGVMGVVLWSVILTERRIAALTEANIAGDARLAALEERLVAFRAEQEAGTEQLNAALTDLAQFNAQSRRLGMLTALTDILPGSVWISELSITGNSVLMSGFVSGDVAEIVTLLHTQGWAETVRLEGPITYDSYSDQNRFDLSLQIASPGTVVP